MTYYTKNFKMKSENTYIGDDKFKKFLDHYSCPTPIEIVKMRFIGAVCSPNEELRPTDVIASLWTDGKTPRLETKNEAQLFFKFFMGLWDEMFHAVLQNDIALPKIKNSDDLLTCCTQRYNEIEQGFLEGFWGGCENLKLPAYIAQVLDSLTDLSGVYHKLAEKTHLSKDKKSLFDAVIDCDRMVNKSIRFLVENYALPHMEKITASAHNGEKNGYN